MRYCLNSVILVCVMLVIEQLFVSEILDYQEIQPVSLHEMTAKILATKSLMNEHCELLQGSNYWAAQCFKAI